jgi:thioester reductase-like protein
MSRDIFLTGFPGFIASRLIPRLIEQRRESKVYLLIQKKFQSLAVEQIKNLESKFPLLKDKLIPIEGDLTLKGILSEPSKVDLSSVTEIFNLAAIYDLRVPKEPAYEVNVKGTENLVEFAKTLPSLEKFHHISTCYVAGWHRGEFSEDDFDKGQTFKNYYEETKFISEKIIRENKEKIPFVIYRPSIVIGDSQTGETNKFDGPYPVILLIHKLPKISLMTQIGSGANPVNLIPVDYVVNSLSALSTLNSVYETYHLCDPQPLTQIELIELFGKTLKKKLITVKVGYGFARKFIGLNLIQNITGLYPEIIDYFDHNLSFKCEKTLDKLEQFNIHPPKITSYIDRVIDFALKNQTSISKRGLW